MIGEYLNSGSLVVRLNRSTGGNGLFLINDLNEFDSLWNKLVMHEEGYFSVAPYYYPSTPINLNCTVFHDGNVALHGASVQIIGDPLLTNLKFGFCGNDYGKIKDIEPNMLDRIEQMARKTGLWLASVGYRGSFGIDALLVGSEVYLTEINPRFQGSSSLAAQFDRDAGRPDVFQTHMGSFFGLKVPKQYSLREIVVAQPNISQIISHNISNGIEHVENDIGFCDSVNCKLSTLPDKNIDIQPNGVRFKMTINESVADENGRLLERVIPYLTFVMKNIIVS